MEIGWNVAVLLYTPFVFECFVKKKRLLSQQNVNKTSVTQRKRQTPRVLSIKQENIITIPLMIRIKTEQIYSNNII